MAALIAYKILVRIPYHVIEHLSNEFNNHLLIAVVGCGDGSCEPDPIENMNGNPAGIEISFDALQNSVNILSVS
jgi:hypothetical protein